jgi:hypothetical protein
MTCLFMIDVSGGVFFFFLYATRDTKKVRNAACVRLVVSGRGKGENGSTVFLKTTGQTLHRS